MGKCKIALWAENLIPGFELRVRDVHLCAAIAADDSYMVFHRCFQYTNKIGRDKVFFPPGYTGGTVYDGVVRIHPSRR